MNEGFPSNKQEVIKNDSENIAEAAMNRVGEESVTPEKLNAMKNADKMGAEEKIAVIREIVNAESTGEAPLAEQAPVQEEVAEAKKEGGLFNKIKGLFAGKELSPEERAAKNNKRADEFIRSLTHIKSFDTGLGGLGNFSGGVDSSLDFLADADPQVVKEISDKMAELTEINRQMSKLEVGPEKGKLAKRRIELTTGITSGVRRAINRTYNKAA